MTAAARAKSSSRLWHVPALAPTVLPRDRVLATFVNGPEWRCMLVRGRSGSGKTTAVAQHVRSPASDDTLRVWLSVDDQMSEALFWSELIASIRHACPQMRPVPAAELGRRSPGQWLIRELSGTIAAYDSRLVIVVDDLDLLRDAEAVERLLIDLLTTCENVSLIAIGRSFSYLDSLSVGGRVAVTMVDERALGFTHAEARALFARMGLEGAVSEKTLADAVEALRGWTLGLRLLATFLARGDRPEIRSAEKAVTEEIVRTLPPTEIDVLLPLSVPDAITSALAARLLALDENTATAVLDRLTDDGRLTATREPDAVDVYRMHSVLRETLRARFGADDRFARASAVTAERLAATGDVGGAFHVAVGARLWSEADAIARFAGSLLYQDPDRLRADLGKVPARVVADSTALSFFAIIAFARRSGSALAYMGARLIDFITPSAPDHQRSGIERLLRRALVVLGPIVLGRAPSDAALQQLLDQVAAVPADDRHRNRGALELVKGHIGLALVYSGRHSLGSSVLRAVSAANVAHGNRLGAVAALSNIALTDALMGDHDHAAAAVDEARQLIDPSAWHGLFHVSSAMLAMARLAADEGRAGEAIESIEDLLRTHPDMTQHAAARAVLLDAALSLPTRAERLQALQRHPERATPWRRLRALARAAECELALSVGIIRRPRAHTHVLGEEPESLPARAHLTLASGAPREALALAERCLAATSAGARARLDASIVAVQALLELGRPERATEMAVAMSDLVAVSRFEIRLLRVPGSMRDKVAAMLDAHAPEVATLLRDPALPDPFGDMHRVKGLSAREETVLGLLAGERTIAQIGGDLGVSINTVRNQVASVYRKLGVQTRDEAVRTAAAYGMLRAGDDAGADAL